MPGDEREQWPPRFSVSLPAHTPTGYERKDVVDAAVYDDIATRADERSKVIAERDAQIESLASRLAEAEAEGIEARVDLMEVLEREGGLRHDLERAREALAFYAEESNYDYDETAVAYASNKGDVLADNGERARAALAALPVVEAAREGERGGGSQADDGSTEGRGQEQHGGWRAPTVPAEPNEMSASAPTAPADPRASVPAVEMREQWQLVTRDGQTFRSGPTREVVLSAVLDGDEERFGPLTLQRREFYDGPWRTEDRDAER